MNKELGIKGFSFFIFLIILDQFSKYLIRLNGGFSVVCNKGIAFGLDVPPILFWILWISIIIFLVFKIFNFPASQRGEQFSILNQFPISKFSNIKPIIHNSYFILLIIAGAISNIIDRLRFGCVIDFIDLKYWPVFNLADAFITVGGIFIVFSLLKNKRTKNDR